MSGAPASACAEGSSNNKFLEIFNPTDATIDLSTYAYPSVSNAPTTPGTHEYWNAFDSGATIAPRGVYIICHPSADESILALCSETHRYLSNGDDGYCLVQGTESSYALIDCVGDFNGDPGSGWDVCGVTSATKDRTLVRKGAHVRDVPPRGGSPPLVCHSRETGGSLVARRSKRHDRQRWQLGCLGRHEQ